MSRIVNPVAVRPNDLMHGDVLVVTVALHVLERGEERIFRMYRCAYPPEEADGIPQGERVLTHEEEIVQELFPVVTWADIKRDLY